MIVFLGCVYLHDDGIPESLNDAEKNHVLEVGTVMENQLDEIIQRFKNLVANPELESQMIEELLVALDEHFPKVVEASTNPAFFLSCDETMNIEERLARKYRELDEVVAATTDEITHRLEIGNHDKSGYDRLAIRLRKMGNIGGGPCDPNECFWCLCKNWGRR